MASSAVEELQKLEDRSFCHSILLYSGKIKRLDDMEKALDFADPGFTYDFDYFAIYLEDKDFIFWH